MKIRYGFVTNSSSSSFIVAFDKVPEGVEELQKMLFSDLESYPDPYADIYADIGCDDYVSEYPASQVAETVWNDLKGQKKATKEKIAKMFASGWLPNGPDYNDYRKENGDINWSAYQKDEMAHAMELAKEFLQKNKGKYIFIFTYGDDSGRYFSALEHGGLFRQLPHERISHH